MLVCDVVNDGSLVVGALVHLKWRDVLAVCVWVGPRLRPGDGMISGAMFYLPDGQFINTALSEVSITVGNDEV